jgi:hypothetical protein
MNVVSQRNKTVAEATVFMYLGLQASEVIRQWLQIPTPNLSLNCATW